jgi:hypothetical protein
MEESALMIQYIEASTPQCEPPKNEGRRGENRTRSSRLSRRTRMSNFQDEVNRTMNGFVATIAELARRAAIETLESAFGGRASRSGGAVPDAAGKPARRAGQPRGGRGAKRTPADLEALSTRFASFVQGNPGLRIEQINKQLGTTTRELALPIRRLVADGVIDARGHRRSTTYFAGKKKAQN